MPAFWEQFAESVHQRIAAYAYMVTRILLFGPGYTYSRMSLIIALMIFSEIQLGDLFSIS